MADRPPACTCVIINGEFRASTFGPCPVHGPQRQVEQPEKTAPEIEVEALRNVVKELTGKVQHLVDLLDVAGRLEDHAYTFPDGDIWKSADVENR